MDEHRAAAAAPAGEAADLKTRLLKVIAAAAAEEFAAMLDRLWSLAEFRVQRAPRTGLVMYTVRDPFDTPFHLGEVLVSEAEVALDGHAGCGILCGDEPEGALLLAAVEAAQSSGRASLLSCIEDSLCRLEEKHAEQTAQLSRLAAATAVRFESMKKETVDFGSLGE